MNAFAIIFLLINSIALLALPRRWAPLPLLIGACYMTGAQGVNLGVFYFSVLRLLVAFGVIRIIIRHERPAGGFNGMDHLMIAFAMWVIFSSIFHVIPKDTLVFNLGLVYNTLGIYFLIRCFCTSIEDIVGLVKITAILLGPVALEMLTEQLSGRNWFSFLGGVAAQSEIRNGRIRSQGPFAHSILAGTVGAVCVPLMVGIWRRHPRAAKGGIVACFLMVVSSASSGPLMSVFFGGFALALWRWRHLTRHLRRAAIVGYILLDLIMKAPAYFLIARIDLTGSSTGFHRAELIRSAFAHFGEWALAGTDYTRHWMVTGVSWSPDHADITNHYIKMGVIGGFPLMILFIAVMWCAFRYVGQALRAQDATARMNGFLVWTLGASLFAHAATCISVCYFDQSFVFLYTCFAMIGALPLAVRPPRKKANTETALASVENETVVSH